MNPLRSALLSATTCAASLFLATSADAATVDVSAPIVSLAEGLGTRFVDVAYASATDRYLVVWSSASSTQELLRATLLDGKGAVVQGPFDVGPSIACQAVASNGRDFVVGTSAAEGPAVHIVDSAGNVGASRALAGQGAKGCPKVAWDGDAYRIVWQSDFVAPVSYTTYAPPAPPEPAKAAFPVSTSNIGDLACVSGTCLFWWGTREEPRYHLAAWKRDGAPKPHLQFAEDVILPPAVYDGAFGFVWHRNMGKHCPADASICRDGISHAVLTPDDPRLAESAADARTNLDWSAPIELGASAVGDAQFDFTASTLTVAWDSHEPTVPTQGTILFHADAQGVTPTPVVPVSTDATLYTPVALKAGPRGRVLLVGLKFTKSEGPFDLFARGIGLDGLPSDPGNPPPSAEGGATPPTDGEQPGDGASPDDDAASSTASSSGCGCRAARAPAMTPGLLLSVVALGVVVRGRRRLRNP